MRVNSMKTTIELKIGGKNVEGAISRYVKSINYREVIDGEADTLELTLHDVEGLFIDKWYPPRNTSLELTLLDEEFNRLELGEFVIDEVENSTPPSECKMKATSIPPGSAAKNVERSRSWEDVTLSRIARDIAASAGLMPVFDSSDDPHYDRIEQSEQSDLKFLHKLCRDAGLAMKVNDTKLIVFEYERYEKRSSVATLARHLIKRFSGRQTLNEVYSDCKVSYKSGAKGEMITGSAGGTSFLSGILGGSGGGKTLKINKKVSSEAEASRLAKKKLREKNREECTVNVTMVGDFRCRAGANITLDGYGAYDGKYSINKATHAVDSGGYTTTLELKKCG